MKNRADTDGGQELTVDSTGNGGTKRTLTDDSALSTDERRNGGTKRTLTVDSTLSTEGRSGH